MSEPNDQQQHNNDDNAANNNDGQAPRQQSPTSDELTNQLRSAQAALEAERRARIKSDNTITALKQGQMNDAEKAVATAREEGKSEALKAVGTRLAAAEFRARATGKLPDPGVLIDTLDLARFVGEDGEPDTKLIDTVIGKLEAALANGKHPAAPQVPGGPRQDPSDTDWLRQAMTGGAGR